MIAKMIKTGFEPWPTAASVDSRFFGDYDLGILCCSLPSQINCSESGSLPLEPDDCLNENKFGIAIPDVGSPSIPVVFDVVGCSEFQASHRHDCSVPGAEPKTRNPNNEKRNAHQRIAGRRNSNCDRRGRPTRGTLC